MESLDISVETTAVDADAAEADDDGDESSQPQVDRATESSALS
jgi:hypothetical protein